MRRAQVTIFILVGLFLVGVIVLLTWLNAEKTNVIVEIECRVDADCVPNECCDAKMCVPKSKQLDCTNVQCAPGCNSLENNYLGCGAGGVGEGSCTCIANKCQPYFP